MRVRGGGLFEFKLLAFMLKNQKQIELKFLAPKLSTETLCLTEDVVGKDGKLNDASVPNPRGITIDAKGNLIICCEETKTLRKMDLKNEMVTTLNIPDLSGCFTSAISYTENLYVVDKENAKIFRLGKDLKATLIYACTDDRTKRKKKTEIYHPSAIVVDNEEIYLYLTDYLQSTIKRLELSEPPKVELFCGYPNSSLPQDGIGENARFYFPLRLAKSKNCDYLFVTEARKSAVRFINVKSRMVKTIENLSVDNPTGIVVDRKSNLYVCDSTNQKIIKYSINDGKETILCDKNQPLVEYGILKKKKKILVSSFS